MNAGKQFEADFKASVPSDAWCYRLKDSAATYYGGNENLSFSIDNICDFLVYRYPMNHLFELKTIETPSIPLEKVFGKYDKAKCKYRKEKHITDMVDAMGYSGQTAHVIVNYRAVNRTFAIPASKILAFRYNESRKSIPWQWAEQEGIEIKAKRLRVHWRYDVDGLIKRLEKENMRDALEKSEPANIWFDAKKVLPEKDKEVLVKREKFGIEIAFLSYDGLWQEHNECIVLGDVTYWAYLPEPPKEV